MNRDDAPPLWMECVLLFLLRARDRETVSGDLDEEFREKLPELGRMRASFWYMRQVLSFAPRRLGSAFLHGAALRFLCVFTAMAGIWLAMMDLRFKHPGYAGQELIAGTIVCQAIITLVGLRFRQYTFLRWSAMIGSLGLLLLAGKALAATLRGAHFEGYVLLISLALIVQAVLTLSTLRRVECPPSYSA